MPTDTTEGRSTGHTDSGRGKRGGVTHWHTTMPAPLAARVDLLLLDPVRARIRYGARSGLVEKLLTMWLRAHETGGEVTIVYPAADTQPSSPEHTDAQQSTK